MENECLIMVNLYRHGSKLISENNCKKLVEKKILGPRRQLLIPNLGGFVEEYIENRK